MPSVMLRTQRILKRKLPYLTVANVSKHPSESRCRTRVYSQIRRLSDNRTSVQTAVHRLSDMRYSTAKVPYGATLLLSALSTLTTHSLAIIRVRIVLKRVLPAR